MRSLSLSIYFTSLYGDELLKFDIYEHFNNKFNTLISLGLVEKPSARLNQILSSHNLPKPVYILEYEGDKGGIKKLLNSISGIYIVINLSNGNMYVGSATLTGMYRRYRAHLYLAKGGSVLVNKAVEKYGISNFAFIVIETVPADKLNCKDTLLSMEQKFIDLLKPVYNILKTAGSVMNLKWSLDSRENFRQSIINNKDRIAKFRALHLGKTVSEESKELIRNAALNRIFTEETRLKMSKNNAKSLKFTAYINGTIFKQFTSIAEAAEFFFQDRTKRSKIKTALSKHTLLLDKYELRKD